MAEATAGSVDLPPNPTTDFDMGLSVPPLDTAFFSQQLDANDGVISDDQNVIDEEVDFDFSFDDLYIPSAYDLEDLLNLTEFPELDCQPGFDANFPQYAPNLDHHAVDRSTSLELLHASGEGDFSGDRSSNSSGVLKSVTSGLEPHQISVYLNATSQESNGSIQGTHENCGSDAKVTNCPSPESQGSGNRGSNVSESSNHCATRSVSSSANSNSSSIRFGAVYQKIESAEPSISKVNSSLLKRKKNCEDLPISTVELRINKSRRSNFNSENIDNKSNDGLNEDEEKRNARLVRNRESAHLSRQRKKHYVNELEEKVKMMHLTIQDLNAKISYFMAENATLRQQMGGGSAIPPPPVAPSLPGMYPHPAMMYPWIPYAPPYMMKPQGSQVPLVPIPRLKPQQTTLAARVNKKVENKNNEGPKIKKVAGISFLGLLFFILLFGGLAPIINMRYGGVREAMMGGESYVGVGSYEEHHGRVLMVNGSEAGEIIDERRYFSSMSRLHCGHDSGGKPNDDKSVCLGNASEPLVASLYVPRNDKLVKIDGNLIIHSVLASEKAMSPHGNGDGETSLAVPGDLGPSIPRPGVRRDGARRPLLRALGSSSAHKDSRKYKASDGTLQQWFHEGLAGPLLSSGMCTEVFQFEVSSASPSGAIFPTTIARNISVEQSQNATHLSKGRNRRILHDLPVPLPESTHNIFKHHSGRNSQKENLKGSNSSSPMVVSVLVDPREAGDADVDGVMGTNSLPRIFVVVLIDSVKYVTYSCILPFKGPALPPVAT